MASQGNPNGGDDQKDTGWSLPLTSLSSSSNPPADSLLQMSPPLPTLPFELITEILQRLPVKLLMKLKCICKSWNSLISSDRKFARKQLHISRMNPKLILTFKKLDFSHMVYPLSSFFTNGNGTIIHGTHINYPLNSADNYTNIVGSCDGILCLTQSKCKYSFTTTEKFIQLVLWNPFSRKYNLLPALDKPRHLKDNTMKGFVNTAYGFGYDHLTDKYKVVAVFMYYCLGDGAYYTVRKTQVMVHTSGTNSWRLIQDFPSVLFGATYLESGIFVSGTINWLVPDSIIFNPIVSLDLGIESYQEILPPHYEAERRITLKMGVSRDCLCIIAGRYGPMISDIWLMKEYGNTESWTKLASVPHTRFSDYFTYINKVLCISEDNQMLLEVMKQFQPELVVYDPVNSTLKIQNFKDLSLPEISIESLISPCS